MKSSINLLIHRPSMKVLESNVFSHVCLSFCLSTGWSPYEAHSPHDTGISWIDIPWSQPTTDMFKLVQHETHYTGPTLEGVTNEMPSDILDKNNLTIRELHSNIGKHNFTEKGVLSIHNFRIVKRSRKQNVWAS